MNEGADVCNCSAIQLETWDNRQRACAVGIPQPSNDNTDARRKESLKVVKEETKNEKPKKMSALSREAPYMREENTIS